jgi:hypothetical protein
LEYQWNLEINVLGGGGVIGLGLDKNKRRKERKEEEDTVKLLKNVVI